MKGENALSLVFIVLLLSSSVALTGCMEETAHETPEDVVKSYVEDLNDGNLQDALNRTIFKFNQTRYEWRLNEVMEKTDMEINDINVTYEENMNESRKEDIEEYIPQLEENYSVDVEEYCHLKLNYTSSSYGIGDRLFTMVKIDSEWYITFYEPKIEKEPPIKAMAGFISETNDGWIIEITGGSVAWDSNRPQIYNKSSDSIHSADSGIDISTFNSANDGKGTAFDVDGSGTDDVYIVYNDNNVNEDIDGGDSFKITIASGHDAAVGYMKDHHQFKMKGTNLEVDFD